MGGREGRDERRMPMLLLHRRRRHLARSQPGDRSRGAVLVEAAFITPLFFLLVLGIIEFSLAMNDDLALAHSVRAGSRVASASGNDVYADYGILQAIKRESAALGEDKIERIVVYEATGPGEGPTDTCKGGTPSSICNVYDAADLTLDKDKFGCREVEELDKYWCPTDRKVSLAAGGTDYVGVWMQVRHPYVTRMFGRAVTLTDQSVIRLEPRVKA